MSHFSCLVITEGPDQVGPALQPYHEFECTGQDDQYVQDVDITEEARAQYAQGTRSRLRDPEGALHCPYEDRFYRDPTDEEKGKIGSFGGTGFSGGLSYTSKDWGDGKGYRTKIKFIPDGWQEVNIPTSEAESFAEFVEGWYGIAPLKHGATRDDEDFKYGFSQLDEAGEVVKVIDRTNPAKKWDWWVIGGRYSGKLLVKDGAAAVKGRPGTLGEQQDAEGKDQCRVGDMDFDAMLQRNRNQTEAAYRKTYAAVLSKNSKIGTFEEWSTMLEAAGLALTTLRKTWDNVGRPGAFSKYIDEQKEAGNEDAVLVRYADSNGMDDWSGVAGESLDTALNSCVPLSTFAILYNGQWYERGDMGWWGVVHDEKDEQEWKKQVNDLLTCLRPEQFITVVDCHI